MKSCAGSTDRWMFRVCFSLIIKPCHRRTSSTFPSLSQVLHRSSTAMEQKALRESAGRLGQRMKELGHSVDGVMVRCCQGLLLHGFCMGSMLSMSRESSMTCDLARMLISVSLVIFPITGFFLYDKLRVMLRDSAEMELVRAELRENRRRLLELGMDHDAYLVEIATASTRWWAAPPILVFRIAFSFVFFSSLIMYWIYTGGCHR